MSQKRITDLALDLTAELTSFCDNIKGRSIYTNQLLRSCSSIGANSFEAHYAQSTPDFISKLEIALKECYETEYWLKVLERIGSMDLDNFVYFCSKCGVMRRMLIASIKTTKTKGEIIVGSDE